ncbi:MAG: hypothetical protein A2015_15395 [Spirochaetes bacterium GWF1_31_7]|nr:MAG: hypothetical protein A2Y30_11815 [Spirochaetes bacterium GWE1_32_154]OHD47250.1 MAG: hypothetical protein A2Y29_02830 [Spirochaetes bacterium GWE2_31_10]OHD52122.1 MAG: hypothetical protein A2015_15395 [Spirochaetes bacterium GWF1_31_7]OHD73080.1 MAG: hypothetical protein A2355_02240 [Spirochaetes bacterium RIFOXYB1_FULL_32_8]HBD96306.1 hypothetical protein [Spirochaetia bacterium]
MLFFRILIIFFSFFLAVPFSLVGQNLPVDYQSKTALEKQNLLWRQIESSEYTSLPTKGVSPFDIFKLFQVKYLTPTITHQSDEMPLNRKRLIHSYGSVAKIQYTPSAGSAQYTGLFKSVLHGIIRASVVQYNPDNLQPGIALKFLIDGKPSLNTVALHTIDGQGKNYNYFAYPLSNIIPPPKSSLMMSILNVFTKAAQVFNPDGSALKVSLKPFAEINADGSIESNPIGPEQIFFYPATGTAEDSNDNRDFRLKLNELSEGSKLFDVFVKPADETTGLILIGEINLESRFIASKYGDEKIFFQHIVQ